MPQWLQQAGNEDSIAEWDILLVRLVIAFLFGCVAAGIYALTIRGMERPGTRSLLATFVLLSVLIALVTMVIGNSIAKAFSLVGALSIVRFRTVVEDTRDTAFVIFAVILGMAAGAGFFLEPMLTAPLVLLAAWLFRPRPKLPTHLGSITMRLAAAQVPQERLAELLKQHVAAWRLTVVATARGGAALDLTYSIRSRGDEHNLSLVSALTQIEGVQSVELKVA